MEVESKLNQHVISTEYTHDQKQKTETMLIGF